MRAITTLFFLAISTISFSQTGEGCDGARYRYRVFEEFTVEYDVVYGNNITASGNNIDLVMDIYRPAGDTATNRPAVVCAHGGFFVVGSNDAPDIVPICEDLARMGYVAVSISYRLGLGNIFQLEQSLQEAVVRGVHDGKAAVRYLRKTHDIEYNIWGIDPDRIIMGGASAGAFIALHATYVDLSEIPSIVDMDQDGLQGGNEGASGSPGYSSDVLSIFSMSGAIGNVNWINDGDTPIVSTHGTSDNIVPYGVGQAGFFFVGLADVEGSSVIHERTDTLGIDNCFYTLEGAGHIPHATSDAYYDSTRAVVVGFTSRQVCPTYPPICEWYDVDAPPEIETICLQDLIVDGIISIPDVLEILSQYGCGVDCYADMDGDGFVSVSDVMSVLSMFGSYCE